MKLPCRESWGLLIRHEHPGESVALYGRLEDSDVSIEASFGQPAQGTEVGLMVRASPGGWGSPKSMTGYLLRTGVDEAVLVRREGGAREIVLGRPAIPMEGRGIARRVRLQAEGDTLRATVHRSQLLRAVDAVLPYIAVGLYTRNAGRRFVNPRIKTSLF